MMSRHETLQREGASLLGSARRAILGDAIGTGKTKTAIHYIDAVAANKVLVIAPKKVLDSWEAELESFAPSRWRVRLDSHSLGDQTEFLLGLSLTAWSAIVLLNYESWRERPALLTRLVKASFDTLIVDEAHTVKNQQTNAFRGVKRLSLVASNLLLITATEIVNEPGDLFALLHLLDPERFPHRWSFLDHYCYRNDFGRFRWRMGALDQLRSEVRPQWLKRSRDDFELHLVIPPRHVKTHGLTLTSERYPRQFQFCRELAEFAAIRLASGDIADVDDTFSLFTRRRQALIWPDGIKLEGQDTTIHVGESIKLDAAMALIRKALKRDRRTVVFCSFNEPLRELERRLDGLGVILDGNTSSKASAAIQASFRSPSGPDSERWRVLLANAKVGGVGLNLQGASEMVILDRPWNPAQRDQQFGRIDRLGQTRRTTINILDVLNSVDGWLRNLIREKGDMISVLEIAMRFQEDHESGLQER